MPLEIERKFLVAGDYRPFVTESVRIVQAYLSTVPGRSVRVRIRGERGYLTIKGAPDPAGVSRYEWEREIPVAEAEELLELCEPGRIEKTRSLVPCGGHCYEVDEFSGANHGLVLAEIELSRPDEPFMRPDWLGEEVTGQAAYYNSRLMKHPFRTWGGGI